MAAGMVGRRLRLLAVACLVSLVLAEVLVRVLGLAPPLGRQYRHFMADPDLPFRIRPNSVERGLAPSKEFRFEYRHNSQGLRDVEHTREKPEGAFRIVAVGDSFTYGIGAAFDESYLAVMERQLNARAGVHPRVETVRAGVPRYFPQTQRIWLERHGLAFQPDLVLVGFLPNDVYDTLEGLDAIAVDPSGYLKTREARALPSWITWVFRFSHAGRLAVRTALNLRHRGDPGPQWNEVYRAGGLYESAWLDVERELARIAGLVRDAGAKLVVLHIPQQGPWDRARAYPAQRLAAWAEAQGDVGFVDALPALQAAAANSAAPLYFPLDGHCTPAGYRVIGETLAAALASRGEVP